MDLLREVEAIVAEAGRQALLSWGNVQAELKPDETSVTEVDRRTEDFLAEKLTALLPHSLFAGEEQGRRGTTDGSDIWVCDPIDGTLNYVHGLPHWGISAGLLRDGEPVLGVVHCPVLGVTYSAAEGMGARRNGKLIRAVSPNRLIHEDLLCMSTNALKALDVASMVCRIRCLGSIALELCLVAEGHAIGAIGLGEGIVDLAASLCICKEAGAESAYLSGASLKAGELLQEWRTSQPFWVGTHAARALLDGMVKPR